MTLIPNTPQGRGQLIVTGFARAGTLSLAHMMAAVGITAAHESFPYVGNMIEWLGRASVPSYDEYPITDNAYVNSYVERFPAWPPELSEIPETWCIVDWTLGMIMSQLREKDPGTPWIILFRDPEQQCGSLSNYLNVPVERCAHHWMAYHLLMLKQIGVCDRSKTFWMSFDKMIEGQYNRALLNLFHLSDPNNLSIAQWKDNHENKAKHEYARPDLLERKLMEEIQYEIKTMISEVPQ